MQYEDALAVLNLKHGYSQKELTLAYRTLAKKHHPDVVGTSPSSSSCMSEINLAYALLKTRVKSSVKCVTHKDIFDIIFE